MQAYDQHRLAWLGPLGRNENLWKQPHIRDLGNPPRLARILYHWKWKPVPEEVHLVSSNPH